MFTACFHQAGTNYLICCRNITLNNANLNNVAILWNSLSALIKTYLYCDYKRSLKAQEVTDYTILSVHFSTCLSLYFSICSSIFLCLCRSTCFFVYLFNNLSFCSSVSELYIHVPSVHPSVSLFIIYLSIHPSVCDSVHLCTVCPSVWSGQLTVHFVHLSFCPFFYLFFHLSIIDVAYLGN